MEIKTTKEIIELYLDKVEKEAFDFKGKFEEADNYNRTKWINLNSLVNFMKD